MNNGDLPAYIKRADIQIGGVSVNMPGEWTEVILPGEATTLYGKWFSSSGTPDTLMVHLELKDGMGKVVSSSTNQVTLDSWERHVDWVLNYNVGYPADWIVTEDTSSIYSFVAIESPSEEAQVTMGIYSLAGS